MNITKIVIRLKSLIQENSIEFHHSELISFYNDHHKSDKSLINLLMHASKNVPFYSQISPELIENFPVVDKIKIKSAIEEFKAKNYLGKKVVTMITSGSTGTPFTVYQDLNKKARNYADTIYFGNLGGYEIGNKLLYLKIWVKNKMNWPIIYRLQNIIPIDVITLSDSKIKKILDKIENNLSDKFNILGYVSALEQIIKYCENNNKIKIAGKVSGIITMSERLGIETQNKLESLFNCSVVSRYSNLENGIIAQQLAGDHRFLVNTASYFVEILNADSAVVLENGKLGRIVITDLYNYAMPMIRYDTGDFGILEEENGKTFLRSVEGRKLDLLYNTKGELVSSYIVYKNMWQYNEISQYQLIQTEEKSYLFKINCDQAFTRELQLVEEFKEYLGEDADFTVQYVDEIPLLNSGKRRKIVNLYKETL